MKRCGFMNIDEIIEGYADRLSKDKGLDIIINDRYSLLKNGKINNSCGIINGWHNNPYCLKIKSNKNITKFFKVLEKEENIFVCDFKNKDYFWLNKVQSKKLVQTNFF